MKKDRPIRKNTAEVITLLINLLEKQGYSHEDALLIYPEFIENEIMKRPEQGLDLFARILQDDSKKKRSKVIFKTARGVSKLDCGGKFIYSPLEKALSVLEQKAKKDGIHLLAIKNNTCFVKAGFPVYKLVHKGLIAFCCVFVNFPIVSPVGIGTPIFGTNPIALGVPYGSKQFFIFDSSTSSMSNSKFKRIRNSGKYLGQAPLGQTETGDLTTVADDVKALIPMDGNRGLGFSIFVEFLAGSMLGYEIGRKRTKIDDSGVIVIAIDPSSFMKFNDFTSKNNAFVKDLKSLSKQKLHVPGERYELLLKKRKILLVKSSTWSKLNAFSA